MVELRKPTIFPIAVFDVMFGRVTDVASIETGTGRPVRLFDPRQQSWQDHFVLRGAVIEPLTEEGEVTIRLLRLNSDKRLDERRLLIAAGRYPR